jgi:4-amino-4-deoxy-L-arabinose transferase-like glycosyltransferase
MNSGIEKRASLYMVAIIAISICLRLTAVLYMGNTVTFLPGTADQVTYHTLALRIIDGHGFTFPENWWPATQAGEPTAHWSYLYTFYLVSIYSLFGPSPVIARILQAVLVGLFQPLLVFWIGRMISNNLAALVAAGLTAVYAYFIYYAASLMTESFFICAVLASLYLAIRLAKAMGTETPAQTRWLWAALGLSLGAAILLRQLFMLFVPLLFLWLAWCGRKQLSATFYRLAMVAAIVMALILPFTAFNYARFGEFVLLNTNAGYAFYWANHPAYGTQFESIITPETGNYLILLPLELKAENLNEAQLDKELLRRGIAFVIDEPGRYLLLSLSRVPLYFMFWPTAESSLVSNLSRVFSFGLLWPFMLYGVILAAARLNRSDRLASPTMLLLGFCLFYTLVHVFTWTLIRYRLPVDAVLLPLAGAAVVDLYQRIRLRRFSTAAIR